jgi:hypothetical protein
MICVAYANGLFRDFLCFPAQYYDANTLHNEKLGTKTLILHYSKSKRINSAPI